jgi:hypothetical protein
MPVGGARCRNDIEQPVKAGPTSNKKSLKYNSRRNRKKRQAGWRHSLREEPWENRFKTQHGSKYARTGKTLRRWGKRQIGLCPSDLECLARTVIGRVFRDITHFASGATGRWRSVRQSELLQPVTETATDGTGDDQSQRNGMQLIAQNEHKL